jgi:putative CocE/NonD family hydrolase
MRDGVRIAVDVWLPSDLRSGDRISTIMRATRYWRAYDVAGDDLADDSNFALAERFNGAGYALVLVDARGSGASFGFRPFELFEEEVLDYGEIVDWIVAQAWSDGNVGAWGVSYTGNTAEMLAVNRHPAVKAIAPLFNDFDNFGHLVFPGSVLCIGFLEDWGESVHNMDLNDICALQEADGEECEQLRGRVRGVKPVDEDADGMLLAAAVREHESNTQPYHAALQYEFRDDPFGPYGELNVGYRRSPAGHLAQIEESGVPILVRVGWLDAGTVNGAIGRYTTIDNPQRVFIGPWDHGARNDADPFLPPATPVSPATDEQYAELFEFFDIFLRGGGGAIDNEINYYTMGEGEWKTTVVWPPEGFTTQAWYFGPDRSLVSSEPTVSSAGDRYAVDYEATTGRHNRWFTNGGAGDVVYPDRAGEDRKLLTYTSDPLEQDVEITGHPLVTLYVSSTDTDGAFFVYLEDVAPDGRVTYVTEGQLRAMIRQPAEEEPLYTKFGPHRTERRDDAMPLVPGEIEEIQFDLWPTSVLIRAGHRIRVAVAGADKDSFLRYPRDGSTPTLTVYRDRLHASRMDLPMKWR